MSTKPPGEKRGSGNNAEPGIPGINRYSWLAWIIITAVIVVAIYIFSFSSNGSAPLSISYSAFVNQVKTDQVASVTINGQKISGAFITEKRKAGDQVLNLNDAIPDTVSADDISTGATFTTTMPAGIDSDIVSLLELHNVPITAQTPGGSIWPTLLTFGLPILLFGGLFYLMMRGSGMNRGRQEMFGFSRTKARLYDEKRPMITFADVAGEDEAKAELSEVVDFLQDPTKYHAIGARLPRGILLVGPPGTGKTLLARAVAGQARVPFFTVSASEFVEMFVGVGAGRVRDLFEKAKEAAPSIIFVDELDAVGRQRFAGIGGGNDEREQTLNQLLVEMDGFEPHQTVIVIAATNRPDVLDPALLRPGRFDRQVTLGLPDRRGRTAILNIHTRGIVIEPGINLDEIASVTSGFSGADLANLVNEAALIAARRDKQAVDRLDFDAALDKILLGAERPFLLSDQEKRVVAFHEGGHALVAHLTPGADPLRKISIIPRGQSLGVTVQAPVDDRFNYSRDYLIGRLAILMGGRAAERLVVNEITTGAQNDLKEATSLARRMVGLWGMSDEVGPFFLGTGEEHVFLGREIRQDQNLSEEMLNRSEEAIQRLLREAAEKSEQILAEHRIDLDHLATVLIEEETLDQVRIDQILNQPAEVGGKTDLVPALAS
ncbi:MAG: ATP-dependent zinc metalloprotease FtsH [Nitrolancea sp.]